MRDVLIKILSISVLIGVPSSTFLLGLNFGKFTIQELKKHYSMILRFTLVMFVIMPMTALTLIFVIPEYKEIWSGIFLVSIAPAMPVIFKISDKQGQDSRIVLIWFVIAIVLSIFFIPLNLTIAEYILNLNFELGFLKVLWKLLMLFVLPMVAGFIIHDYYPDLSSKIVKPINLLSKAALLVLLITFLIISVPILMKSGPLQILIVTSFLIFAFTIGIIFGKSGNISSPLLEASLLLRFPAPAIVFTQINNTVEKHAPVIIIYTVMGFIIMSLAMKLYYRKKTV